MKKKYLIATSCNQRCELFLVNHWLRSLKENVDLTNVDILVIDFGLSPSAQSELKGQDVILFQPSRTEGHINNLRFLELRDYLTVHSNYEQVILCDSGDIIFQTNISNVFELQPEKIKAVREEISPNMDIVVNDNNVLNAKEIKAFLRDRNLINAGFVVYPREKFNDIVCKMFELIRDKDSWGVDMVILNYVIYRYFEKDFFELPPIFNFIPTTSTKKYFVKDGKFYLSDGTLIAVVHNAGGRNIFRPIRNFGYGKEFNKPRFLIPSLLRMFYRTIKLIRKLTRKLRG
ncbi:hypothetical protein [Fervidobacterium thailandense]|uniref:Glycosyl transferase family 8 n=1 Tax=Fervidobacterium thailandense TaxID=1008305 RepID=A0A1E3G0T2_9BACT|nr:hypothetical protein [Fervidobacterium thailandense]ODN29837.1 hypothetical protein A4H02_08485 [Fervidobacterium thailandense]